MIHFNIILHLGLDLPRGLHPSGFADSSKHSSSPLQPTPPTFPPLYLMFLVMVGQGKNRECSLLSTLMSAHIPALPSAKCPRTPTVCDVLFSKKLNSTSVFMITTVNYQTEFRIVGGPYEMCDDLHIVWWFPHSVMISTLCDDLHTLWWSPQFVMISTLWLLLLLLLLFTAIGLSPGGSGYFTCKQNMKLVTTSREG